MCYTVCWSKAVEGGLSLLELLGVLKVLVIRCVLLSILEVTKGEPRLLEVPEVMRNALELPALRVISVGSCAPCD